MPLDTRRARLCRSVATVLRDRRGATAMVFAATAVTLFGFVALATEGGNWYYTHRNARSAADMAALAGASAYQQAGTNRTQAAVAAATDTATRNGFTNGATTTVNVEIGSWTPPSPPYPPGTLAKAGAVRVTIEQRQPTFLAGMLLGNDEVAIRARARGAVVDSGPACILSLLKDLTISGNNNTVAPECVLASNATDSKSINFNGSATISAKALFAAGGCFQCAKSVNSATLPGGFATNQPPVPNPYQGIDDWLNAGSRAPGGGTVPSCRATGNGTGQIPSNGNITSNMTLRPQTGSAVTYGFASSGGGAACSGSGTITVSNGATLTLEDNATYFFYNTSLDVRNGSVNCANCTLVFTGPNANSVGSITVNANGGGAVVQTNISAPRTNAFNSVFNGVAIYRDKLATLPNGNTPNMMLDGGANVRIGGAIVGPTSRIRWNGNSSVVGSGGAVVNCGLLVGGEIILNGNGGYNLASASNCSSAYGINAPQVTAVRLVD
jgi:hypothetical protein